MFHFFNWPNTLWTFDKYSGWLRRNLERLATLYLSYFHQHWTRLPPNPKQPGPDQQIHFKIWTNKSIWRPAHICLQFKQLHLTICIFPSFISNGPPAVSRIESTWKANIFHHLNKSILECLNFRSIWSKGRPPSSNFHTMILKDWVDVVINTPILIRPSTQSPWYGVGNV